MNHLFVTFIFSLIFNKVAFGFTSPTPAPDLEPSEVETRLAVQAGKHCETSKYFEEEATYSACKTKVDGHENLSTPQGLTDLGCHTFCKAAMSGNVKVCTAEAIYTRKNVYKGCTVIGGENKFFSREISEEGCEKYCDENKPKRSASKILGEKKEVGFETVQPK